MTRDLTQTPALLRLEETLLGAAARFGRQLQRSADPVRRAADALLIRLGLDPAGVKPGARLPGEVSAALRRENERLRRAASRGDARYDINRHIAVMRLLRGDEPVLPAAAFRETRQPGAALNCRFRRRAGS